jgi:hypothetical protein
LPDALNSAAVTRLSWARAVVMGSVATKVIHLTICR